MRLLLHVSMCSSAQASHCRKDRLQFASLQFGRRGLSVWWDEARMKLHPGDQESLRSYKNL